jgi:dienelactone hydrolase
MRLHLLAPCLLLTLAACGGKADPADTGGSDGGGAGDDGTGDDGAADGADGGDDGGTDGGPPEGTPIEGQPNGTFLVTFALVPVGDLSLPFQAEVVTVETSAGERTIWMSLRASKDDGATLSDVLVEASGTLADDGSWTLPGVGFVLPADFAPTGSDVEVVVDFLGQTTAADAFCGELDGSIVTFDIDLAGSTFGAVPWEARGPGAPLSCGAPPEPYTPIEACPALSAGLNADFPSGREPRSFEIVLPASPPEGPMPLVFAFHGLGGDIASMLEGAELRAMADDRGAILVVPQGADFGGSPGWDAINADPYNKDIQLFDDLYTCVTAQYDVDLERVYATGMSNGGLLTGALMARRSDRLAAVAPMSGGVITTWPAEAAPLPLLAIWGGETDFAFEQDFHALSTEMIAAAVDRGQYTIGCDHGLGHELRASFWPWTFDFLLAHTRGVSPSPWAGMALPESFPEYCAVVD